MNMNEAVRQDRHMKPEVDIPTGVQYISVRTYILFGSLGA